MSGRMVGMKHLTSSPPQAARILAEPDFCSSLFGGFLPQPPYFSGGQQRGFTFGLSAHRSCRQKKYRSRRKKERGPYIPGLNAEALRLKLVTDRERMNRLDCLRS